MSPEPLDEREFELINIVGARIAANQRDLSRLMELSLGMTNMLIRRLISKGYIRIKQLDKRKVTYILTPKGFAEKMRKSVKYTLKTIQSIGFIKERIKAVVLPLYEKGERKFFVLGLSDLAMLIEMVFKEHQLQDYRITYLQDIPEEDMEGTILICKEDVQNGKNNSLTRIDLIQELARSGPQILKGEPV